MKLKPMDIRVSFISNELKEHENQRASSFRLHTLIEATQENYIKIAKDFK